MVISRFINLLFLLTRKKTILNEGKELELPCGIIGYRVSIVMKDMMANPVGKVEKGCRIRCLEGLSNF
jgi:hypothetical protein